MSEFSLFLGGINVKKPDRSISLEEVITWVRDGKYSTEIANVRAASNPKEAAFHKKSLDFVTPSGIFSPTRLAANLQEHSGLIVIDLDHIQSPESLKLQFQQDPFVNACFVSPSANGLKVIVKIKDTDRHKETFADLAFYFNTSYILYDQEKVDPSGSDVCRACFLSHDPTAYYNPDSKVYSIQNRIPEKPKSERQIEKDATELEKWVSVLTDRIETHTMDICNDYGTEWLLIAFSLSVLKENGRSYFHRISKQNAKYNEKDTDAKFDNALKTSRFTNIAKLVSICKDYGIDTSQPGKEKPVKEKSETKNTVQDNSLTDKKKAKKENREDLHPTVWYKDGGMEIKSGKYFDEVAPNFQVFIKYKTEDEQENVTWILEIKKIDEDPIYLEVFHDDFCSARKLKNMLATKRLGFKIKDGHLDELHSYLFTRTKFSSALKVLRYGFHKDSKVYFFANKALNLTSGEIVTPDDFGIVEANEFHLSIPKKTKMRQQRYTLSDTDISFQEFWKLYATAHTYDKSFVPICFYIFSLFRDIGLKYKNFSPILFLKGGYGTGKSSMIRVLTAAFGYKQEGVNLKSKNTDAALIKLMSQTSNAIIWFDEFHNELPNEGLLQAAYDNDGYHKSTGDNESIDTNTVEIYSALALTSNYLPQNDIFFSRCLYIGINSQKKTDQQTEAFNKLNDLEDTGLGCLTVELLRHRQILEANDNYLVSLNRISKGFKVATKGQNIPQRFFENMAQVMAAAYTFQCLGLINILTFETSNEDEILQEFVSMGVTAINTQVRIMSDTKASAEFFEILQMAFDAGAVQEELHFRFNGDNILLNFRKLYNIFSQKYSVTFRKNPPERDEIQTELATLAGHSDWESLSKGIRFANDGTGSSTASTIPQTGSCELNYKQLREVYSIDFQNRPILK
ncbi:BT4734/BF3469 family protein [Dyadobacter sp. LHD-138]|uniref:BT4734/BF3469 family protein n=1 Tax=Dyadobacter sp. LHD-138 TaxID=3071413 RepID=UPI0027DEAC9E|nr:BT4734/BF3469 family protein [Dyadobacter sp. LHD-138]MDQ6479828.1 BT4734/BF3469 family protein [Dyadobacter sp. LHD-138]